MSATVLDRLNHSLIGRYHVERELGKGGMATVFVAGDLKHPRQVALKVLRPELVALVGASRFLAEIATTAKLQHPHILPLFDSGEADGLLYYVMPVVEGESLRERLDRERQLPVDEAVRIATQIAEALDYAHRHGVIHRDIKPANVLIHDGQPLISDFGIALASESAGARLTETGISLGTPHYMSPEQATGDARLGPTTDVWALGCVLHEMLVGEPPYGGTTATAVLGKIITAEPKSVRTERKSVPLNVEAAITRALEKLPSDRFQTARDFRNALADPTFRHGEMDTTGRAPRVASSRTLIAASVVAAAMAGGATWAAFGASSAVPAVTRPFVSVLTPPPGEEFSSGAGVAISPDGRTLVVATTGGLYRRDLDGLDWIRFPGARLPYMPFFSPDGSSVGYFEIEDDGLKRVRLDGSELQQVAEVPPSLRSAAWSTDSTIVFNSSHVEMAGLSRVSDSGGAIDSIPNVGPVAWIDLLPGGEAILGSQLIDGVRQVVMVRLETGVRTALFPGTTPRYASGEVIYWLDGALWSVSFDLDGLAVSGEPSILVQNVVAGDNAYAHFAVQGDLLVYRRGEGISTSAGIPVWVGSTGVEDTLDIEPGFYRHPRISPDGRRVALTRVATNEDVWIHDLVAGTSTQLTFDPAPDASPIWTPGGEEIVFRSSRSGAFNLYATRWDGTGDVRRVTEHTANQVALDFAVDGSLIFGQVDSETGFDIWSVPMEGAGAIPRPVLRERYNELKATLSPGGRFIAYESTELGRPEVFVRSFPDLTGQRLISSLDVERANAIAGADPLEGRSPAWSRDGAALYYQAGRAVVRAPLRPTDAASAGDPQLLYGNYTDFVAEYPHVSGEARQYDVARDGRLLMILAGASSGASANANELVLVQNWRALLEPRE